MRLFYHLVFLLVLSTASCGSFGRAESHLISGPDKNASQIEYFIVRPAGSGPWPTVVFLHGYQPPMRRIGGKSFVDWGVLDRYAKKGYLAVSVSLPGYGNSSGPEDFAGPLTQRAVSAIISKVESDQLANPDKILIQGISLGAVTSALITAHDPHIAGQVLISGLYDFSTYFSEPKFGAAQNVKSALVAQTGGSDAALMARSALPLAGNIKAATLILNGAKDDRTDPDQALRMAAAIRAQGTKASAHIYPEYGHEIPFKVREAEVAAFVDATLRP